MTEHDDEPNRTPEPAPAADDERAREAERMRQLILTRRNRFMAAALAGAGVALNGCWDSGSSGGAGASGAGGQSGESGASGASGAGGTSGGGGVAGPGICLSIEVCPDGSPPPCVCLEPPFPPDDAGADDDAGLLPPGVCLTPA